MTRHNTHYIPSIAITAIVAVLSLAPILPPEPLRHVAFFDKWAHFIMYGIATLVYLYDEQQHHTTVRWALVISLSIMLGISMECGQYFTPYRSFDPYDILANIVGVALGALLFLCIIKFRQQ